MVTPQLFSVYMLLFRHTWFDSSFYENAISNEEIVVEDENNTRVFP
jgi:hypothetical protein